MARKTIRIEGNADMPDGEMIVMAKPEGRGPRILLIRQSEDDLERVLGYADIKTAAEVVVVVSPSAISAVRGSLAMMALVAPGAGPGGARLTTHIEGEPRTWQPAGASCAAPADTRHTPLTDRLRRSYSA